ncbi:hypothetical protein [Psychromicrobium sp. YIM B11713]|uniref:hypothetical protein n=1 Tax=Psychromicrobium sp. YIM B11713 TaxID=3145233 RepID=UPI00374F500B
MFSRIADKVKPLIAGGAIVLALALSLTVSGSASAAVEGTGAGKLVLSPSSGTWASGNPGDLVIATNLEANFSCPTGSTNLVYFITEPGSELPQATTTTEVRSKYPISNYNYAEQYSDPAFTPIRTAISTYSNYATPSEDLADVRTALAANHTYSFGLVCAALDENYQLMFTLDGGKPVAVWSTFQTDAQKNWSAPASKADTTIKLTGNANGGSTIDLSAEVDSEAAGGLSSDAKGSIEFFANGLSIGSSGVSGGKASFKHSGLTPLTEYKYTAKYTPSPEDTKYNASPLSAELSLTTGSGQATSTATSTTTSAAPTGSPSPSEQPTTTDSGTPTAGSSLADGGELEPGRTYTVSAPAGSFTEGDTVAGVIHSDPISLTETASAAADGSAVYTFTAPQVLPAGDHTLVLTGTPSGKTYSLKVRVIAPGGSTNSPFTPLTAWVSTAASTPAGMAGLFALALGLVTVIAIIWHLMLKRRPSRQH